MWGGGSVFSLDKTFHSCYFYYRGRNVKGVFNAGYYLGRATGSIENVVFIFSSPNELT
jgi:hypothetical protein